MRVQGEDPFAAPLVEDQLIADKRVDSQMRNGIPLLPSRQSSRPVTSELVRQLNAALEDADSQENP